MKIRSLSIPVLIAATSAVAVEDRPKNPLAPTPPLGWNSFNSYGVYLHEEAAYANLEAMARKLKPHGYEFFVINNGWFGEYALQEGTFFPAEKHAHDIRINEYGHFLPSKVYFPNGLKPIADRCHELGLKFGVHLMRGIPRKAYEQDLPIKGTKYTARDIAATDPKENCKWCTYCYGVDMTKPGAQEWYDGLIRHIADLGVDLIKYDDIVPHPDEVEAVAKAIAKTGKPIVLSLSPGNLVDPDMLACNQNGMMGALVLEEEGLETWKVEKKGARGEGWVGIFNRQDRKIEFELSAVRLGLDGTSDTLIDVWSNDEKHLGQTIKLNPNGVLLIKYSPRR